MRIRVPLYSAFLGDQERTWIAACLDSGMISSLGPHVKEFEQRFARRCGLPEALAVSNGTAALHLALAALGIGPGDEVVVPALTFVATANAVTYTGATPRFVDVSPEDWGMNVDHVRRAVGPRTKAILSVHLYGAVSNRFQELLDLAAERGIPLVEDAAEALGSRFQGRQVGGLGTVGAFSFYGNKLITTGEGGMLVSANAKIIERARFLRDQAMDSKRRYYHPEIGYNYRMTALQAAIGIAQLERMDDLLTQRKRVRKRYDELLPGLPFQKNPHLEGQQNDPWLYTLLFPSKEARMRAEESLTRAGVETRPVFVPMPHLPMYEQGAGDYPVSASLHDRGLSLPSHPFLKDDDIHTVAEVLRGCA